MPHRAVATRNGSAVAQCPGNLLDRGLAIDVMALLDQARLLPDASCATVLQPSEWKLLRRKFEPKHRSQKPPTLHQAGRWIAQLGGFLARTRDGEPGLKTLWRGLGVLHHRLEGAQLSTKS